MEYYKKIFRENHIYCYMFRTGLVLSLLILFTLNANTQNIIHFNHLGLGPLEIGKPLPDTSLELEISKHPAFKKMYTWDKDLTYYFYPNNSMVLDSNLLIDYFIFALDADKNVCFIFTRFAAAVTDIDKSLNAAFIKGEWGAVSDFGGPSNAMGVWQWYNKEKESDIILSRWKYDSGRLELRIYNSKYRGVSKSLPSFSISDDEAP